MKILIAVLFTLNAYAYNPTVTLEYDVKAYEKVSDILFVIDNSGSMQVNQEVLSKLSGDFLRNVGDLNYFLTAINTDRNDPLENIILFPSHNDIDAEFAKIMTMFGTEGDAEELVFSRIIDFSKSKAGRALMRNKNPLEIIILTDEEEQSERTTGQTGNALMKAYSDINKTIHVNAIIPLSDASQCYYIPDDFTPFIDLVKQTGGNMIDICSKESSFKVDYNKLAQDIVKRARNARGFEMPISELKLNHNVDLDSIHISFGSQRLKKGYVDTGWIFNETENTLYFGSKIKLDSKQPIDSKLVIKYTRN